MISKSKTVDRVLRSNYPSITANLTMNEECSICDKAIPEGKMCLRKEETNNIICLLCVIEIAEVK